MFELYLIAHKVSGEPAFDIATRMECPECRVADVNAMVGCHECDHLGYWWIIPTSGHRAYPYYNYRLFKLEGDPKEFEEGYNQLAMMIPTMPESIPDHYAHSASPKEVRKRLESLLAALPPAKPFKRRF